MISLIATDFSKAKVESDLNQKLYEITGKNFIGSRINLFYFQILTIEDYRNF